MTTMIDGFFDGGYWWVCNCEKSVEKLQLLAPIVRLSVDRDERCPDCTKSYRQFMLGVR